MTWPQISYSYSNVCFNISECFTILDNELKFFETICFYFNDFENVFHLQT